MIVLHKIACSNSTETKHSNLGARWLQASEISQTRKLARISDRKKMDSMRGGPISTINCCSIEIQSEPFIAKLERPGFAQHACCPLYLSYNKAFSKQDYPNRNGTLWELSILMADKITVIIRPYIKRNNNTTLFRWLTLIVQKYILVWLSRLFNYLN